MPPNVSDGFVILKEKDQWAEGTTKADVVAKIENATVGLLGNLYEVSQPIQLRFNELIAGVRGGVAIKLYADAPAKMAPTANEMVRLHQTIPCVATVNGDQAVGAQAPDVQNGHSSNAPRSPP